MQSIFFVVVMLLTFVLIIISILSHPHFFIPGLKPFFLQILSTIAFPFFFRTDSRNSPDCLSILLSISVFSFSVFFPLLVVRSHGGIVSYLQRETQVSSSSKMTASSWVMTHDSCELAVYEQQPTCRCNYSVTCDDGH